MLKDAGKRVRDASQPAYARQAAVGGLVEQGSVSIVDSEAFTALFLLPPRSPDSSAQGMNCRSTSVASPPAKNPPGHTIGPKKEGGVLQDVGKQVSVADTVTPLRGVTVSATLVFVVGSVGASPTSPPPHPYNLRWLRPRPPRCTPFCPSQPSV